MEFSVTTREQKELDTIKRRLADHHITYRQIAEHRGCSWHQVWRVLNGHRRSAPVLRAAMALIQGRVIAS